MRFSGVDVQTTIPKDDATIEIHVSAIGPGFGQAVCEAVIQSIDQLQGDREIRTHKLIIGREVSMSGRDFWRFLLSSYTKTPEFLRLFLDGLLRRYGGAHELPCEDGRGLGLAALIPLFERYGSTDCYLPPYGRQSFYRDIKQDERVIAVYRLFVEYFKRWDLSHETDQDYCVNLLFVTTAYTMHELCLDLLYRRLSTGQAELGSRSYEYLSANLGESWRGGQMAC